MKILRPLVTPKLSRWMTTTSFALMVWSGVSAQMLQQPLQTGGSGVPPNLMFTLDDSGSMWWECLPDDACTNGSYGVELVASRRGHLSGVTGNWQGMLVFDDVDLFYNGSALRSATPRVLTRRLRSSAFNPLYYNPAIRYQPWLKADGSRWPDAAPSAAPILAGDTRTVNLEGIQTVSGKWCWSLTSCQTNSTQSAHIARYYNQVPGSAGTAATDYSLVKIEPGKTYPRSSGRTDCVGSICSYDEEIKNFANWFTYYRTRALTAIAGTAESFAAVPSEYRVGFGRINKDSNTSIDGQSFRTLERGVRAFSGSDKVQFYNWLASQTRPSGGTPLRRAMNDVGRYFSRSDDMGPWGANPGVNDPTSHSACRRSIHLLMTDGMWNGDPASTEDARLNIDGTTGSAISGPGGQSYSYAPAKPYTDSFADTLADVAMYYWSRDLRPDLQNAVKPITTPGRENPAFWQHMVNFTIAFGVDGNLSNPGDLPALASGAKNWGDPNSSGAAKVDDLWHAALNSRGRALSARNSVEYADAIRSIIDEMATMEGSDAGVGVSTTTLPPVGSSTKMYTPSFATPAWNGDVKAQFIDAQGKATSTAWTAAGALPGHASRRIFTFDPEATGTKGVEFKWASLSTTMKTALWGSATGGEKLVSYLRGDDSGEGTLYRDRASPLGDIVNSSPALVSDLVNLYYEYLPPKGAASTSIDFGAESYTRFLAAKKLRQAQLLVGANDGMLHAFSDADGVETFAFMPRSILGSVKQLWNLDYTHRYFVDGPIYEADAYDKATARWTNLVQGTGGAGGKYVYSIRMPVAHWPTTSNTAPAALTTAQSAPTAQDILWEINTATPGFDELGYIITKPETGVTRDGTWVTIFGNGYQSASGKAQLFVVNALTGALIKKIDTTVGSDTAPNGLGGVGVVRDAQMRIVAAYAGDLQGNLWKFDLSSESNANWAVAFEGHPLFVARNNDNQVEPITAKPSFRAFPKSGVMVLFGTGKLFAQGDQLDTDKRTLYGIWDKVSLGSGPGAATDVVTDNTSLVTQNVVSTPLADSVGGVFRKLTVTSVDYKKKRGWRLPLTIGEGERLIDEPQIRFDAVFMQTVTPANVDDDCQAAKLLRRGYMLDPFMSGDSPAPFDGNADGTTESHVVDLDGSGENKVLAQTPTCTGPHCDQNPEPTPPCEGLDCNRAKCPKSGVILGAGAKGGIQACFGSDSIRRHWRQIVTAP